MMLPETHDSVRGSPLVTAEVNYAYLIQSVGRRILLILCKDPTIAKR
jgi:hypothetical protein